MKFRFSALVAVLALALFAGKARAQTAYPDLLITHTGDTIRCAFITFDESYIRYYRLDPAGHPIKLTAQKSALRYFDRGYFARREAGTGNAPYVMPMSYYKGGSGSKGLTGQIKTLVRVEAGLGHRVAKADDRLSPQLKDFVDKMRSGGTFGLFIGGFKQPNFGWGGRLDAYWASASDSKIGVTDKVSLVYVGPDMVIRVPFEEEGLSHFYIDMGAGLAFFSEQFTMAGQSVSLSGVGVPLRAGLGFHIQLAENAAIHFGGNAMLGGVSVETKNGTAKEGITRIGASGGLSFNF